MPELRGAIQAAFGDARSSYNQRRKQARWLAGELLNALRSHYDDGDDSLIGGKRTSGHEKEGIKADISTGVSYVDDITLEIDVRYPATHQDFIAEVRVGHRMEHVVGHIEAGEFDLPAPKEKNPDSLTEDQFRVVNDIATFISDAVTSYIHRDIANIMRKAERGPTRGTSVHY